MYCPNCKKQISDPDAAFCPVCGTKMISDKTARELQKAAAYEEEESGGRKLLNVILFLIPFFMAAAVIVFLLLNDGIRTRLFGEKEEPRETHETFVQAEETKEEAEPEVVNQGQAAREEEAEAKEEEAEPAPAEEEEKPEETPEPAPQEEEEEEEEEEPVQYEIVTTTNGQVFPDSSQRYLSDAEISKLGLKQTQYAINEIYARHGYIFADESMRSYYESLNWYQGTISSANFSDSVFNDYEYENVANLGAHRDELAN